MQHFLELREGEREWERFLSVTWRQTLCFIRSNIGHYSFALICVFSCNATTVCEKNSLSFTYNFVKGRFYVSFHVVSYSLSECLWNQIGEGKKDRIKLIYYIIWNMLLTTSIGHDCICISCI